MRPFHHPFFSINHTGHPNLIVFLHSLTFISHLLVRTSSVNFSKSCAFTALTNSANMDGAYFPISTPRHPLIMWRIPAKFQGYDVPYVLDLIEALPSQVLEPYQSHPRGIGTFCRRDPKRENRILVWISPGEDRSTINMVIFDGWRIVLCVPVDIWDAKTCDADDVRRAARAFVQWELMGKQFGSVLVQPRAKICGDTVTKRKSWWKRTRKDSWLSVLSIRSSA